MTGRGLYDFACDIARLLYPSTEMAAWPFLDNRQKEFWHALARRVRSPL